MRKFHIALGVRSVNDSIADYTQRLSVRPQVIVPGEYALWRTETLNFSIRQIPAGEVPGVRHLGWEDAVVNRFTETLDCNGILWEEFSADLQLQEILVLWPEATRLSDADN